VQTIRQMPLSIFARQPALYARWQKQPTSPIVEWVTGAGDNLVQSRFTALATAAGKIFKRLIASGYQLTLASLHASKRTKAVVLDFKDPIGGIERFRTAGKPDGPQVMTKHGRRIPHLILPCWFVTAGLRSTGRNLGKRTVSRLYGN
jgi:hypothetical protein